MPDRPQPVAPIRELAALRQHFAAGGKPPETHRIGVEHEKIVVGPSGAAPTYEGRIRPLLEALQGGGLGWQGVLEDGQVIGLARDTGATVSLEPGGQLELSDAPRVSAWEAAAAVESHLGELSGPARALDLRFLGIGFRPFDSLDDVPWMPKGRYRVMRAYLPTRGARAHDMMKRTATVQANLDYADQHDCADKMRVAMGTSSLVTALFAASPIAGGRITEYQSYRAACWLATDDDRCGLLPFVFAPDAGETLYERYAEWALDVPMFFVFRGGHYTPVGGMSFRRFVAEGFEGVPATMADWTVHLSTLFPEVRLKQYLEVRGADAGPLELVKALPALYRGLLYDAEARAAAWALVDGWSFAERLALRASVPRDGLRARVRGQAIGDRCRELVEVARAGLSRLGADGDATLLEPLERIAQSGRSVADEIRELHERVSGDPAKMIDALALPLD